MAPAVVRAWILCAALAVVVLAAAACGGGEQRSHLIQVIENGIVLGSVPRSQAVTDISARVRFDVKQPSFVPSGGYSLQSIEARLPEPVEFHGQDGKSNAVAISTWSTGTGADATSIAVAQLSRPLEMPIGDPIDTGVAGVSAYIERHEDEISIGWNTADEGFQLVALGPDLPSEADLIRMLSSLR